MTEPGLPQPPVLGFEVDALDPNTLYLATTVAAGTLWRSADGGLTWIKANAGLPSTGSGVDFFKEVLDGKVYLYLKMGNQFYISTDRAANWTQQSVLPGTAGAMQVSDAVRSRMYYVEPSTLAVFASTDEGHSWQPYGQIPGGIQNATVTGIGLLSFKPGTPYISVDAGGNGQAVYANTDPVGGFVDQSATGLGLFRKMSSGTTGPNYALTGSPVTGTYRSIDSAQTWQLLGTGGDRYAATLVDPNLRTIVWGVKGSVVSNAPTALVESTDGADSWTVIPATITPTLAKPAPAFNIRLQQGAPYSISFNVQTAEDPSWKLPATVSTSGEPWIQIGATSGTTPLANSITINTAGLAPGTYNSTLTINAPQSTNKSVSVPVHLTVVALGSLGPGYIVSTVAGSGAATDARTSGKATDLGMGGPKALSIDNSGNVLISAGNRIWQLASGNLTALAGNGTNGSSGDGGDPLSASISDPDAIAFDSQGSIYFTEYAFGRIRKLSGTNISTTLDMLRLNQTTGSHTLLFDPTNRYLLAGPSGLLRYDGLRLVTATAYPFSDPYSMIADAAGNLYLSDRGLNEVFKLTPASTSSFTVTVIAGTGLAGFAGDGGPATQASLNAPAGLALDAQGTLYIADSGNNRIRAIGQDGNIRTIAGSGISGFAGDNTTADFAAFSSPMAVAVDASGNILIADSGNNRVRALTMQVTTTPKPSAIANPSSALKLSPGGIFILYGDFLAAPGVSALTPNAAPWPRSMAGVSVTINGVLAPLYYVSTKQINGQVPFETPVGTATAVVAVNGSAPAQLTFPVVAAEPGILVQGGGNQAVAVNQDSSINSPSKPASAGDIEVVYLSGIGQPDHPVATGAASPSSEPFARVNYLYSVTVGGRTAQVYFFGYAPGFPALVQVNFQIPSGLAPGDYPVVITVNGEASLPAIISVK